MEIDPLLTARRLSGRSIATGDKFDGATLIELSACKETVQLIISSENLGRSIAATRFVTLILLSDPIPCRTASDSRQSYHSVISRRSSRAFPRNEEVVGLVHFLSTLKTAELFISIQLSTLWRKNSENK